MEKEDADTFTSLGLQALSVVKKLKIPDQQQRDTDDCKSRDKSENNRAANDDKRAVYVVHSRSTKKDPDAEAPGLVREEDDLPGPSFTRTGEFARSRVSQRP